MLLRKDAQTRRKTACRPGMAGVKAPASEVRRFRNPLTDRRAACELYIPVCPGVAAELLRNTQSSDCPGCYGQPQQRVGSLGERRHVGRLLRFVASACGQCQREPFGLRFGRPAPAEQREPGIGPFRALRPSICEAVLIVSATGKCGARKRIPPTRSGGGYGLLPARL